MAIWFKPVTLLEAQSIIPGTMISHLGIVFTELGDDFLVGTMPVDDRTHQPHGLLHGGASAALAETLASAAANMVVDPTQSYCVGLELNANHLAAAREGVVTGRTTPLHLGRSTQVWDTRITQGAKLICASRLTLAVLKRKPSV
jgi:1,4-dihydroxy-2-naphthoyl-CoA hydrolase